MTSFKKTAALLILISFVFGTAAPVLAAETVGNLVLSGGNKGVSIRSNQEGTTEAKAGFFGVAIGSGTTACESSAAIGYGATALGNIVGNKTGSGNAAAFGYFASANGYQSIAIGNSANASGRGSVGIGNNAATLGHGSISIGSNTVSGGHDSFVVGYKSETYGTGSFAGGGYGEGADRSAGAKAYGTGSFAFGALAVAGTATSNTSATDGREINASSTEGEVYLNEGANAFAFGREAQALKDNSIAFGAKSKVSVANGIGIGVNSSVTGADSVALGNSASASGSYATALGYKASGKGMCATAVGASANASTTYATALGAGTYGGSYATAVGYSAYGSGSCSTAVGYSACATSQNATALGYKASGKGMCATAVGASANASTTYATALGAGTYGGSYATAVGYTANGSGSCSTAAGYKACATSQNATAIGYQAQATNINSVAIGANNKASGAQSTVVGYNNTVSGTNSGAFGDPNNVTGNASYAFGNNNTIAQDNTFVLGNSVTTTQANSVVLGSSSTDKAAVGVTSATINGKTYTFGSGTAGSGANGVVSVGSASAPRQIVNVANGAITSNSTDAVTGAQLYAVASEGVITDEHNYYNGSTTAVTVGKAVNAVDRAVGKTTAGNYIKATDAAGTNTIAAQIQELDTGIGAKITSDGNVIKKSATNSVNANISLLDAAIGDRKYSYETTAGGFLTNGTTLTASLNTLNENMIKSLSVENNGTIKATQVDGSTDIVSNAIHDYRLTDTSYNATTGKITLTVTDKYNASNKEYVEISGLGEAKYRADGSTADTTVTAGGHLTVAGGETTGTSTKNIATKISNDGTNATIEVALKDAVTIDTLTANTSVTSAAYKVGTETYITSAGIDANNHKIINVPAGDITATSTDAVNGSQLAQVLKEISFDGTTGEIKQLKMDNGATATTVGKVHDYAVTNVSVRETGTGTGRKTYLDFTSTDQYGTATMAPVSVDITDYLSKTTIQNATGDIVQGKNMKFDIVTGTSGNEATVSLKDDINLNSVTVGDQTTGATQTKTAVLGYDAVSGASLTVNDTDASKQSIVNAEGLRVTDGTVTTSLGATNLTVGGESYITSGTGIDANNHKITNVLSGDVTSGSADAVNGSQLYGYSAVKVQNGTAITGNITAPDGVVLEAGGNVTLTTSGNKVTITSLGGTDTLAVHYDKDSTGKINSVTLLDKDDTTNNPVALKNVADGSIAPSSKDAVNGGQLYAELRPVTDGTYVKTANTTAENLKALDDKVVESIDFDETTGKIKATYTDGTTIETTSAIHADARYAADNTPSTADAKTVGGENILSVKGGETTVATGAPKKNIITAISQTTAGDDAEITVTLDKDIVVDTVTANTSITSDAYKVGTETYITSAGIDANNHKIINVEAGSSDTDAVNYGQFKGAVTGATYTGGVLTLYDAAGNTILNELMGGTIDGAVVYDDSVAKTQVTLNPGGDAAKITNVADGNVAHGSTDAINGGQLFDIISTLGSGDDANAVHYTGADKSEVVLAGTDGTKITNLKKGDVSSASTDAVNGAQLYERDQKISSIQDTIGDMTSISGDNISSTNTIAQNLQSLNDAIASSGEDANAVHYDTDSSGRLNSITLKDTAGGTAQQVALKNVAAGEVSPTSTDAVNGAQLYARDAAISANTQEIREVGAISAALAGLHYIEPSGDEDDKLVGAAAYGGYRGEGAVAVGLAYKASPNFMLSASTSIGNSQNAYNAGFSIKFGKGETAKTRAELKKQVKYVNEQNMALKAENASQNESIIELVRAKSAQDELIRKLLERVEKLENDNAKSVQPAMKKEPKTTQSEAQPKKETKSNTLQKPVPHNKNIQVFSSAKRSDSQRLADKLCAKGYNAFVGEGVMKGRLYYRVFVDGGDNPQATLAKLKKAGINGFIFK